MSSEAAIIREATVSDAHALKHLFDTVVSALEIYPPHARAGEIARLTHDILHERISTMPQSVWLAEQAGQVVGFCILDISSSQIALEWIGLDPAARHQGTARRMVSQIMNLAVTLNISKILAATLEKNIPSRQMFLRAGFELAGKIPQLVYGLDFLLWRYSVQL